MSFLDIVIVVGVLSILALLAWSRMMQQTMLDTLREIRTFLQELGTQENE